MNKYQEALDNLYRRSTDTHFYIPMGEDKLWKNTLQELVDKATPMKTKTKMNEHNHIDRHCPICDGFVYSFDKYCGKCGQRIRSDE